MWSDNETAIDLLGFQHLITTIVTLVRRERLLPATLGVFGDWGSGKSSLLQMVAAKLREDTDCLVVNFNGWQFEGYEDAKSALMGTILDEIAARASKGTKAKRMAKKLLRRVNWLRVAAMGLKYGAAFFLAGPAGAAATGAVHIAAAQGKKDDTKQDEKKKSPDSEDFAKLLREDDKELRRTVREFRKEFDSLLKESGITSLVVIVDDLDRCLPETIIETLEAIKLFLFVPRTAFIIGADERLVKYAVRRRFPELPGENAEVGRDYLEKLIQFPVRIPPLDAAEMETYINLLFAEIAGLQEGAFEKARLHSIYGSPSRFLGVRFNHGIATEVFSTVPPQLSDHLSMAQPLAPVLAAGLNGNPRQCKRFLNMLMMRTVMAASRELQLDQPVLAKLMLLEYIKPITFKRLAEWQASQEGLPKQLAELEQAVLAQSQAASPPDGQADAHQATPSAETLAWLSDTWIRDWLLLEPKFSGKDLRPYFYFSRDVLGPLGVAVRRMSPQAQEALNKLLGESEGVRKVALNDAKNLSPADAAAIFEALATRAIAEQDLGADGAVFSRLFDWTQARLELRGQLVVMLGQIPDVRIPLSTPLKLVTIAKGTDAEATAKQLLDRWKKNAGQTRLAKAAEQALTRF